MSFASERDQLFREAQHLGYHSLSLYGEQISTRQFALQENIFSCHHTRASGFSLEAQGSVPLLRATLASLKTPHILEILRHQAKSLPQDEGEAFPFPAPAPSQSAPEIRKRLQELFRKHFSKTGLIQKPQIQLAEHRRVFFVDEGPSQELIPASDAWFCFEAHWSILHRQHVLAFRHALSSLSEESLWKDLEKSEGLAAAIEQSQLSLTRWPAPRGPLPVYWSSRALSVLMQYFLQAFEADRVLRNDSFLNHCPLPLGLQFSILENPNEGALDQEGSPRRPLRIFSEGRPRALACRRAEAKELSVPTTGHARRRNFFQPSRVGFWKPEVIPAKSTPALLENLSHGISVRDLSVPDFDPSTGNIQIHVQSARLIHQGKEGESTESFVMDTNLIELLAGMESFEDRATGQGLPLGGSRTGAPPMEIHTPAAYSPSVFVPGSVECSQYW